MQINVYDNLASPDLFEAARAWLLAQSPIFGWRAHAQAMVRWTFAFIDKRRDDSIDEVAKDVKELL